MNVNYFGIIGINFILIGICYPWNILQIVPGVSDSHIIFNYKFAQMLKDAGHNVTLLTVMMTLSKLRAGKPPKDVEEIRFGSKYNEDEITEMSNAFQDMVFKPMEFRQIVITLKLFQKLFITTCTDINEQDELYENLSKQKFDLATAHFATMCPVGIAKKLNIPKLIWVVPGTFVMDTAANLLSLPATPSYIPYLSMDLSDRMTFFDRTKNFLMQLTDRGTNAIPSLSVNDKESKAFQKFPEEDFPHLSILAEDIRALLINGEDFLDFPRPLFTNTLHIGDLKHKEAQKLEDVNKKEWQSFMDNSDEGVIMFSLGTVANTSVMPLDMKKAFFDAFSKFPSYSIIWRLEGLAPEGIENQKHIKIVKWIPQNDLLNHPKLKLFITHGGYNSLLETAQAGVPMIMIPLFADQYGNARRAERYGLGLTLDKLNSDAKVIVETIRKVLYDERYRHNTQKFSSLLRDKLIPSENFTLHLIDKIIRSSNWPLVRAPKKLNLLQYFCMDVILFYFIIAFVLLYLFTKGVTSVYRIVLSNYRSYMRYRK